MKKHKNRFHQNIGEPIKDSVSVDCSCIDNPGPTEFQCIDNITGETLFSNYIGTATNNIGEFLAIVRYFEWHGDKPPGILYSDSLTAISWIENGVCKTTLERNNETETAWVMLDAAMLWLSRNKKHNVILRKWHTRQWGEISADYGRKSSSKFTGPKQKPVYNNRVYYIPDEGYITKK